jgi:hypothetical protein
MVVLESASQWERRKSSRKNKYTGDKTNFSSSNFTSKTFKLKYTIIELINIKK